MSRYQAFSYHFLISLAIFFVLAYLVLYHWYPDIFFSIDGGWEGMRIIIGVDLILGPVLTLIVFRAGKPGLKFDLAAIGTLQAVCLTVGTCIVYSERPIFSFIMRNISIAQVLIPIPTMGYPHPTRTNSLTRCRPKWYRFCRKTL